MSQDKQRKCRMPTTSFNEADPFGYGEERAPRGSLQIKAIWWTITLLVGILLGVCWFWAFLLLVDLIVAALQ